MASAAPIFSKALFRKNLQRFWPIFTSYIFIVLLIGFDLTNNRRLDPEMFTAQLFMDNVYGLSPTLALLVALFSIVSATAVFSYLFNTSAAGMMNALPYTRRTMYFSNYLSGLFMVILPLLVFFLTLAGIGITHNCLDFTALLGWLFIFVSLSMLLFSVAVFLAMLTGSMIAHIAFFGIANIIIFGLMMVIDAFLSQYLYGFTSLFAHSNSYINALLNKLTPVVYAGELSSTYIPVNWWVWTAYLLVGMLLIGVALKMYYRRKMEKAGDIITISGLEPVFKYGVTICTSLALGEVILYRLINPASGLLIAWIVFILAGMLGYYVAEALLRKSFKVLDSYKGFVIYALIMSLVILSAYYDWYGYATRMPDVNQVEAVGFSENVGYYEGNILQAETGKVHLDNILNLPESLALTYGTPLGPEKNPRSNEYFYPVSANLTPEETRLLWSITPEIYSQADSKAQIAALHQYLVDNIDVIKRSYRASGPITENTWANNITFNYRLENGKMMTCSFPVFLDNNSQQKLKTQIFKQMASIAGCDEERQKLIAKLDLPAEHIYRIELDSLVSDGTILENESEYSVPAKATRKYNQPIVIRTQDSEELLTALKWDYRDMTDEQMLNSPGKFIASMAISVERLQLPVNNKYRDGKGYWYPLGAYHTHTIKFLRDKGYIDEDVYQYALRNATEK